VREAGTNTSKRGEARRLGRVIADYLEASGLKRRMSQGGLDNAWGDVVGEVVAAQSRIAGFRGNVLKVEVASAVLLQELAGFRKTAILKSLNDSLDGYYIRDIRFQLGRF